MVVEILPTVSSAIKTEAPQPTANGVCAVQVIALLSSSYATLMLEFAKNRSAVTESARSYVAALIGVVR